MSDSLLNTAVDYVLLANVPTPGLVDIIRPKASFEYRVNQHPFMTGARITFKHRKLSEFAIRVRCYTTDDLVAFETNIRPLLKQPDSRAAVLDPDSTTKGTKALDIWHPILEDLDIRKAVVKDVGGFEQIEPGVWAVTIEFLEYRGLPKVSLAKVAGSIAAPKSAEELWIQQLSDDNAQRYKELAGP